MNLGYNLLRYKAFVVGIAAGLLLCTTAHGQTYRLWNGSNTSGYSNYWHTSYPSNWTPADLPNTAGEAVDIDGDANDTTRIEMQYPNFTNGQFRVRSPTTTTNFWNGASISGAFTLTLSPAASFGGIGFDMSSATVDFTIKTWNSAKYLVIALASSQQWNINSGSADGDLIFGLAAQAGTPDPTKINLGGYALTNNVGTGRTLDATYALFQGTGGSLVKTGAGTMILGQTNTYTGDTTIQGGTLVLTNSGSFSNSATITVGDAGSSGAVLLKIGTVTIGSAQTLKGIGTVSSTVSVSAGGTLGPGDGGTGILTIGGDLTLADGTLLEYDLDAINASDKISMTANTLTLNSQEWGDFTFTQFGGFEKGIYVLIDASSISGSLGSTVSDDMGDGLMGTLEVQGNDLVLVVTGPSSNQGGVYRFR